MTPPVLLLAVILGGLPAVVWGAFLEVGGAVREAGFGGAGVALAGSVGAAGLNPAALGRLSGAEVAGERQALFTGLTAAENVPGADPVDLAATFLAGGYPIGRHGTVGLWWLNFSAPRYQANSLALLYGRRVGEAAVGVGLRHLRHQFTEDDYTRPFARRHGSESGGFTLDAGGQYPITDRAVVGLAMRNLLRPNVGLQSEDRVPWETQAGVAYRLTPPSAGVRLTAVLDMRHRDGAAGNGPAGGVEAALARPRLSVRVGGSGEAITAGLSFSTENLRPALMVDYALAVPLTLSGASGSHRVGLTVRFPAPTGAAP